MTRTNSAKAERKGARTLQQKWLSLPRSLRWPLVIGFYLSLIGGYMLWQHMRPQGAALYGHNHTDRPIFSYWVNDGWGGNILAHGGGKTTCCWRIQGDILEVAWVMSRTREQIDRGIERKSYELNIPSPPRRREDRYLHVHFFPGNEVRLAWSPGHSSPYENSRQAPPLAKEAP